MKAQYDVCVIGAGPGGYVAALIAAGRGSKTLLVEKGFLGGTCLNWGCIPTKTLIASADLLRKVRCASEFGIKLSGASPSMDWQKVQERKDDVVTKLRGGIDSLLKGAGVDVIEGQASFADRKTIAVSGSKGRISAVNFIIASGSEPAIPSFIPQSKRILDSTSILSIDHIPKSLLVLGGGVIGCEFASLFSTLGTEVTIVEMLPDILFGQEKDVSRLLAAELKKMGVSIGVGAPLSNIKADAKSVSGYAAGKRISAEYMLVATGRSPVVSGLNLANAQVKTDKEGHIPVDARCRTNVPGIYAVGDVTGRILLAHLASAMGMAAAENASGGNSTFRDNLVPGCIFTHPEIGSVGLTSESCRSRNIPVKTAKFHFAALGKAMALGETSGFCKLIADENSDQVLGAHIIGPNATDLVAEVATAMNLEVTAKELARAIHAHPTLSEVTMEAAHSLHGECVHAPPRRK
ncbi:MAG: dihydrolipoyl dehydrogenase [Victivallales bacterium]|nr:dihydrolipoyl dehydrogenase [Victivallales bacterium]